MMLPAIKLSRNSWHWRLATYYSSLPYDYNNDRSWRHPEYTTDICTYLRSAGWGLLKIIVVFAIAAGFLLIPMGDTIAWLAASYSMGYFLPPDEPTKVILVLLLSLLIMAAFIGSIIGVAVAKQQLAKRETKLPKPGFVSAVSERFKNKTCVSVGFE